MPNLDNSLRNYARQDQILSSIADRLKETSVGNGYTVIVSDQPVPDPESLASGKAVILVSPGDGRAPEGMQSGGGWHQATENGSVIVGAWVRNVADKAGSRESMLIGSPRARRLSPSLLELKRIIIKQLLRSDERTTTSPSTDKNWEPYVVEQFHDEDLETPLVKYRPLLRDPLMFKGATGPLDVHGAEGWSGIQVRFECTWDWDLS